MKSSKRKYLLNSFLSNFPQLLPTGRVEMNTLTLLNITLYYVASLGSHRIDLISKSHPRSATKLEGLLNKDWAKIGINKAEKKRLQN